MTVEIHTERDPPEEIRELFESIEEEFNHEDCLLILDLTFEEGTLPERWVMKLYHPDKNYPDSQLTYLKALSNKIGEHDGIEATFEMSRFTDENEDIPKTADKTIRCLLHVFE